MFEVILIGAGPANLFAAYNLVQHGVTNILLIDKGKAPGERLCPRKDSCISCKLCDITCGWGGAGVFSDGKITLNPEIGGELNPSQGSIDRVLKVFQEFGNGTLYEPQDNTQIRKKAVINGIKLIPTKVFHMGSDNSQKFATSMYKHLKDYTQNRVAIKHIYKEQDHYCVVGENGSLYLNAKNVILALGRNGTSNLPNILKGLHPKFTSNAVDLGIRLEMPNYITKELVDYSYDFKVKMTTKIFRDKVRTFCYSSDTKVYTRSGFKLFSDISLEDEFLSVNPTTQILEWVKAVSTQKYKFNGKMKHIKSHQIDWLVTPEHKMYVKYMTTSKERKPIQRYKFKSIDEIVDGDQVTTNCIWQGVEPETVDINGFKLLTEDYCELLGYYLSEGYSMMRKTRRQKPLTESQKFIAAKPSCLTGICQEKPNSLKKMIECVERCGIDYRIDDKRLIILKDQRLNYYLHNFGKQPTRYIPNDVKNLSPRFINIFLDAYCLGDGHIRKVRHGFNKNETYHDDITFYTSSQRMAEDLCELILKSGRRPYIYENKTKGKVFTHWNGDYESKHNMFYVSPRNNTTHTFNVIKITDQDYDDYVYDVTLEKNHTLLILRNNKIWWGSNCVCPSGEITTENNNDLITCNGHSYSKKKSDNTNFALLVSIPFSAPIEATAYAENMVRLANEISTGIIVQRYIDLKKGQRSTAARIKECTTIPTLNAYPGDLCYSDDTEVLTKNGWKLFKDVLNDDEIATLSSTGYLEYNKAIVNFNYPFEGTLINIQGMSIDQLVTKEHRLWARKRYREDYEFVLAQDFKTSSKHKSAAQLTFKRDAKWNGIEQEFFTIPIECNPKRNHKKTHLDKVPMDSWLNFMGIYLAEGGCSGNDTVEVWQHPRTANVIENLLNIGLIIHKDIKQKHGGDYVRFRIHSTQLVNYLKRFGTSRQKYIPQELKNLSKRQLEILFKALTTGDGAFLQNGTCVSYSSVSSRLLDDVGEVALKIGLCQTKMKNAVRFSQNNPTLLAKRNKTEVPYKGNVYCCVVPNHIIYVRRNNKACWSGNSLVFPYRFMQDILDAIESLDKIAPGLASDKTLLYGVEAKFYSNKVVLDSDMRLANENIYLCGDMSGYTRGILQSAYSGLIASDKIIENSS